MGEDEIWNQIEYMEDEHETLRNEIAEKLEEASRKLQFCKDTGDVIEVLVNLLNELVEILKVEW